MNSSDFLYLKYKDRITACKKSTDQILLYIKDKFNLKEVGYNHEKYLRNIHFAKVNCINSTKNKYNLTYDDLIVSAYEIVEDKFSYYYYDELRKQDPSIKDIYVILEMKTGYMDCNCNVLERELYLYQGVSEDDIKNNTPDLCLYLRLLDEET